MTAVAATPVVASRPTGVFRTVFGGPAEEQQTVAKVCAALHGIPQDLALAGRTAREVGLETLARALVAGDPDALTRLVEPFCATPVPPLAGSTAERILACAFVCHGGFSLDAIHWISGTTGIEEELRDLVEQGSLVETDTGTGTLSGHRTRRWAVPLTGLPAARQAARRLSTDEPTIRAAHAEFYLRQARGHANRLGEHGGRAGYDALRREAHNIESALTWLCGTARAAEALSTVEALTPYWRHTGGLGIARDRYIDLLRATAGLDPALVNRLRLAAAAVFAQLGEPETARSLVPVGPAADTDGLDEATAAYLHGTVRAAEDYDEAAARYEEAIAAGPDDGVGITAWAGLDLALVHACRGRLTEARRVAEHMLVRATYNGSDRIAGAALLRLGAIAAAAGCEPAAVGYLDRALGRLRPLGPSVLVGELLDLVGSYLIRDVVTRTTNVARLLGAFRAHWRLDAETPWPDDLLRRPEDLLAQIDENTIREALRGTAVPLSATIAAMAASGFSDQAPHSAGSDRDVLTRRQWEVARCIGEGLTNKQAARRLTISEWTVVNHMREIMRKLDCSSRVQVARWVHQHGI
ncbi:LuxR C-terminal-related transcriptional regulator [Micromonospora sp. DT228]|uniref:LuxR C-terminal-related transcriptional regulator n=1 Tax=Micromonospora sp. DT228 TaxID=3393443 RepID=UPI003CF40CCD